MSGGSYDYASYEMENGELTKARIHMDDAADDITRALDAPFEVYETQEATTPEGRVYRTAKARLATSEEKLLAELGLCALRQLAQQFERAVNEAAQMAKDLAPLFHALEWYRSGDTGASDVQEFGRQWVQKKLGR